MLTVTQTEDAFLARSMTSDDASIMEVGVDETVSPKLSTLSTNPAILSNNNIDDDYLLLGEAADEAILAFMEAAAYVKSVSDFVAKGFKTTSLALSDAMEPATEEAKILAEDVSLSIKDAMEPAKEEVQFMAADAIDLMGNLTKPKLLAIKPAESIFTAQKTEEVVVEVEAKAETKEVAAEVETEKVATEPETTVETDVDVEAVIKAEDEAEAIVAEEEMVQAVNESNVEVNSHHAVDEMVDSSANVVVEDSTTEIVEDDVVKDVIDSSAGDSMVDE